MVKWAIRPSNLGFFQEQSKRILCLVKNLTEFGTSKSSRPVLLKRFVSSLKITKFATCTSSKMHLVCPQNLAQVLFSIPLEMAVIPRRNGKQRLSKILGFKQGVLWEMCKWRVMFTTARMKLAPLCDIHFLLLLHQPIATHPIFLFYCVLLCSI